MRMFTRFSIALIIIVAFFGGNLTFMPTPLAFAQFFKSDGGGKATVKGIIAIADADGDSEGEGDGQPQGPPQNCAVPPTWGGVIPGNVRFVPTFVDGNRVAHAYCDRQTGLVWDARPEEDDTRTWVGALAICIGKTWNGQMGGRLPSIPELTSLVDTTSTLCTGGGPCLPDGHPFSNVQSAGYWSASTFTVTPSDAWAVDLKTGGVGPIAKDTSANVWCVRGAMNANDY